MCFGNKETGKKETSSATSYTPNAAVAKSATSNLNFANTLRDGGFTPYGGEQVANFSPMQTLSFDLSKAVAGNGTGDAARGLVDKYSSAPAASVSADAIYNRMSPYMNQYVMQALAPQIYQMDLNDSKQRQSLDAAATSSNAFGDARTGVERVGLEQALGTNRAGMIGQAYNTAFNTAIGAGAQDVSNDLSAQNANASYYEQALSRALGGSVALQNLQNQQMGIAKSVNEFGQQMTAQDQARLNAAYNQWMMAQEYPFKTAQLANQTTAAGASAMPASSSGNSTSTEYKPDNSGWALAGAIGGAALAPFTGGLSLGLTGAALGSMGSGGMGGSGGYATPAGWGSGAAIY